MANEAVMIHTQAEVILNSARDCAGLNLRRESEGIVSSTEPFTELNSTDDPES